MRSAKFLAVSLSLGLTCAASLAFADAKKDDGKKKVAAVKAPPPPPPAPKADDKAVTGMMGPFKWGMTPDDVLATLEKQIAADVQEKIDKSTDVYLQTQLRKGIKETVNNVRKSLVKFEGTQGGWDVSIIAGEFEHKNNETMLIYHEVDQETKKDQQRFFFFYNNKLWKEFIAFNMAAYKDKTFDDFRGTMEAALGKAALQPAVGANVQYGYWKSPTTYVRAIDQMQFYGNFCLAMSDDSVEKVLGPQHAQHIKITSHVSDGGTVSPPNGQNVNDPNADIVNRIVEDPASK